MTKYNEALKIAEPKVAITRTLFDKYLKPISGEPIKQLAGYFYDQGYHAWRYGVNESDWKKLELLGYICEKLYKKHKSKFIELVSLVLVDSNNVGDIVRESERNFFEADEAGSDARIKVALDHYKTFFEASFRLWSTVPYFYAVEILGIKSQAKRPVGFLGVSSGIKLKTIRERTIDLEKGKLSDLVVNLSSSLRNAGSGHDSYEFLDNNKVKLKVTEPGSGKLKEEVVTSYSGIKKKIDEARKIIWILRNGLMIYLNKNPQILQQIARNKPIKLREIKAQLKSLAEERWLELIDFNYEGSEGKLSLGLEKKKRLPCKSTEILLGSGERFDVIAVSTEVRLIEQILGVLQVAAYLMEEHYLLQKVELQYFDEEQGKLVSTYSSNDLLRSKSKKRLPKPIKGVAPRGLIEMISEVTVPYGSRLLFTRKLTEMGYKVVD